MRQTKNLISYVTTLLLIGFSYGCAGQQKPPPMTYDISPALTKACERDNMKARAPTTSVAVILEGGHSTDRELGVGNVSLRPNGPTDADAMASNFNPRAGIVTLTTPEPFADYVRKAAETALESRGFKVEDGASNKLTISVDRLAYDMMSSQLLRKAFLETSISVANGEQNNSYQRRIVAESDHQRGNKSEFYDVVGIHPGGVSITTEEQEAAVTTIADVFGKFQDQLVGDPDLLAALRK